MGIFFRYISLIYLKNFFIIFFALLAFYCGVDLLLNAKELPQSANIILLYAFFLALSAINYILPISLVLAFVLSWLGMIRYNELVSLYALGLSKNKVIFYPFLWALLFCFLYVGANFTPFAYANDYKSSILKNGTLAKPSGEAFLKFNDDFIYIKKLENGQNRVQELKIFSIKDGNLSDYTHAKEAEFNEDFWTLKEGNITILPQDFKLGGQGLVETNFTQKQTLRDFKPKIIENAASDSQHSIKDAWQSLFVLKNQGLNIEAFKISLYQLIFPPFFAPFLMLIMVRYFPTTARFFNLAFVGFVSFLVILGVWGGLFLLTRLAQNGVFSGEFGIVIPHLFIAALALWLFYKQK